MICAYCDRPARYAVVAFGTAGDIGGDWETDQVCEGDPDAISVMGMAYCSRHTGSALQWAQGCAGTAEGLEPIIGPVEELNEVLLLAAEVFTTDTERGAWVLTHTA